VKLSFSIIIPVYNRPQEIEELLKSLTLQTYDNSFEVIVVEDGSEIDCNDVIASYKDKLSITYLTKQNSGPGGSRNYGMQHAKGNYFIILDSDVILPQQYLEVVSQKLKENYSDAFGGPDAAHPNFTALQKAINYSMTSFFTTGGIRGKKKGLGKFQPRSFNMGLSKNAYETTQGFSDMRAGEDIDLSFRLWNYGFETQLINAAFVYHKRRNTLKSFYNQTFAFGTARPILNRKYPRTKKLTYWFPSLFIIGFDIALIFQIFGVWEPITCYAVYTFLILIDSLLQNKTLQVAILSIVTSYTQFYGYGLGFLKSKFLKN